MLLSVRGDAQRIVTPDQASVTCSVSVLADTKDVARAQVRSTSTELTAALAELGGRPLTVDSEREPLTWSAHSMQIHPEHAHNKVTGEHGPTGRFWASLRLTVAVRDFALLGAVEALLGSIERVELHAVNWSVDQDNVAWGQVRSDAIRAALAKGRDYATALGGSVSAVEHIADAGLLGAQAPMDFERRGGRAVSLGSGGEPDVSSLDPVPQIVSATIEARLSASITRTEAD